MGDILFQNYLVAYVDLSGQRDILRRMTNIPDTPEEQDKFKKIREIVWVK